MGEVYRARDARLQREVAIKVPRNPMAWGRGRMAKKADGLASASVQG